MWEMNTKDRFLSAPFFVRFGEKPQILSALSFSQSKVLVDLQFSYPHKNTRLTNSNSSQINTFT